MTTPLIYDVDSPRARRTDPLTSHAAGDGTSAKRAGSWLLIETALEQNQPMTAAELVQYIRVRLGCWISESRTTTAVYELHDKGVLVEVGQRKNPSGYMARAWQLREVQ